MDREHSKWRACALLVAVFASFLPAAIAARTAHADLYVAHGDDDASGWYDDAAGLSPAVVTGGTFGQLFSSPVDGEVYAQPLVAQNTLLVATENDKAYGFDPRDGTQRWATDLGTPWDPSVIGCADLTPSVGITGTPVVDPATNVEYLVTKNALSGNASLASYAMHALDAKSGAEMPGFPVAIAGPAANAPSVQFNATYELQRPGLLLLNGVVYAAFGGHCDRPPYTGWVAGVSTAGRLVTMWSAQQSGKNGSGIWQSGGALLADGANHIILATGNGNLIPTGPTPGNQPPTDLSEAVVRLAVQPDGSLHTEDFFTPYDAPALDLTDSDFGSSGPVVLPDTAEGTPAFGTPAHPHLMLEEGKEGYVYLLDRDNLGGYRTGIAGSDGAVARIGPYGGVWSTPAVWPGNGGYVYIVHGAGGPTLRSGYLRAYQYALDGHGSPTLSMVGQSSDPFGFGSGAPIVTSDALDPASALVWMVWQADGSGVGAQLRAYSPVPVNGTMQMVWSAPIGTAVKFAPPAVSGDRLYVGTRDGHVLAFGSPVNEQIAPSPSSMFFGATIVGQPATQSVTFTANGPVTINSLTSTDAQVALGTPSIPLPATLGAGDALTVPVTFTPTAPALVSATLAAVTSDGEAVPVGVSGLGELATGSLSAFPNQLSLGGAATGGTPIAAAVQFSNVGATAIHITGTSVPPAPSNFSVTGLPAVGTTIAPGASIAVSVLFTPRAAGLFTGTIEMRTDAPAPGAAVADVPVSASAAPAPHLTLSSTLNSYGVVLVGNTVVQSVTLTNTGGTMMTLTKSKPPARNVGFHSLTRLDEGSGLLPGQSVTISVAFTATTPGHFVDTWALNGDDDSGPHTITFDAYASFSRHAYWMLDQAGHVYPVGSAVKYGEPRLAGARAAVLVPTPTGLGYHILDDHGHVFSYGDARGIGSAPFSQMRPGERPATMAVTPSGHGYWIFTTAGRVFAFGDAAFLGDMRKVPLNGSIVASVATPSGRGYYMIGSDGGVFGFGDARFYGSTGSVRLRQPVVGIVPTATGRGYWLVASDGGVFGYGDARYRGSMASARLNKPIVAMVRYGDGYLMVASDGGIFIFSSAPFVGSLGSHPPAAPVISVGAFSI
jgi:outer membrane protein assembly factor BamB